MCFFQDIIYRTYNLFIIFPFCFGVNGDLEMFLQSWSINNKAWHFQPLLFLLHNFSTIYYSRIILYLSITVNLFTFLSLAHHLFFSISFSSICNNTAPSLFIHYLAFPTASTLYPSFLMLSLSGRGRLREGERGAGMRGESCLVTVAEKRMWEGLQWARVKSGVALATEVSHCLTGFGAR